MGDEPNNSAASPAGPPPSGLGPLSATFDRPAAERAFLARVAERLAAAQANFRDRVASLKQRRQKLASRVTTRADRAAAAQLSADIKDGK